MPAHSMPGGLEAGGGAGQVQRSPPGQIAAAIAGFGAAGLLLAVVLLIGVARLAATVGSVANEQQALAQLAESSRAGALDAQAAAQRAEAGVMATADAADRASGFVTELATALRATASSLRVDVFGSQPFAAAADRVAGAADQADQTAAGLTAAANEARSGAAELHSVTSDLGQVADEMAGIGSGLAAGGGLDGTSLTIVAVAVIGLLIWLAVPAAVCLWFGFTSWWRSRSRARRAVWPGREP